MIRYDRKIAAICGMFVLGLTAMLLLPRIPQDPLYHTFADRREIFGLPNFWNVITNLPFIAVGLSGLRLCSGGIPQGGLPLLAPVYRVFFLGVLLVGFGSSYYHLDPSTETLIWDRLPMSVAFMAFLSMVWGEHVSTYRVRVFLGTTLIVGLGSVMYWYMTETRGAGDLRPYALTQFLPMLLIPLILIYFPSRFSTTVHLWVALGFYATAKVAEHLDAALLELSGVVSGHALKHVLAALGTLSVMMALMTRRPAPSISPETFELGQARISSGQVEE